MLENLKVRREKLLFIKKQSTTLYRKNVNGVAVVRTDQNVQFCPISLKFGLKISTF
jgi:hypothetical protein